MAAAAVTLPGGVINNTGYVILLLLCSLTSPVEPSHISLLSGTLRTFQTYACDDEYLNITCPENTTVSIAVAVYGRHNTSGYQCSEDTLLTKSCKAPHALKVVEETCRAKNHCLIKVNPNTFGTDPCPDTRKYAEVAFKCRPAYFPTKYVCSGEQLKLKCDSLMKIAVYSANFGVLRKENPPECPQVHSNLEIDCQVSYATETVITKCQGNTECNISADFDTFGNPMCPKNAHVYLKVVYTCVPKEILRELSIRPTQTTTENSVDDAVHKEIRDPPGPTHKVESPSTQEDDLKFRGETNPNLIPRTTIKTDMQSDENQDNHINCSMNKEDKKAIGFLTDWFAAYKFIKENKEKFILYVTVSLGFGVVAFLIVLSTRLYVQRRRDRQRSKMNISEPLACSFDENSDGGDHFETGPGAPDRRHTSSIEVVRYANRTGGGMRRQDSDTHPRAPMSRNMNNYYYS